jgi:tetratricopeptide (TPR) repeat protein
VGAAFRASHTPYADAVLRTVERAFDQYSQSWVAMQVDACETTHVRREQPQEVLDLRVSCLDDRLFQLKSLIDVYMTADAKLVEGAAQSARSLPSLGLCADIAALRAATPPRDPETRKGIVSVRQQLASANALGLTARYDQGIGLAKTTLAEAQKLAYPRIEAEAQLQLARLLDGHGDYADSARAYSQALTVAVATHHDEAAARATLGLTNEIGLRQSHFEDADRWVGLAEAQVGQRQRGDELLGLLYSTRSHLRAAEARYDDALADATRALEIQQRVLGRDSDSVAETYGVLAQTQKLRAQYAEALVAWRRALAIQQRTLGPDHPMLLNTLVGIADVYVASGQPERAVAEYQGALATLQRVQPDHPLAAFIHNELGTAFLTLGKGQEAFEQYEQALALWEKQFGPSLTTTAGLNNLGEAKLALNQPAEALRYLNQANDMCERNLGSSHLCGIVLGNMGEALRQLNRPEQALSRFHSSVTILEKALGPKHPALADPLLGIGRVELGRDGATSAKAPLERALAIREAESGDGVELADVRVALAQALWPTGDHERARNLATQAHATYAKAGPSKRKPLAEVTAWLEHHGSAASPAHADDPGPPRLH